ncbi:MAG: hypothetical protein JWM89_1242 [Acidimicrobiales bacterium]|nr:hypothetical protein [Acidimicrobiales bacterium]
MKTKVAFVGLVVCVLPAAACGSNPSTHVATSHNSTAQQPLGSGQAPKEPADWVLLRDAATTTTTAKVEGSTTLPPLPTDVDVPEKVTRDDQGKVDAVLQAITIPGEFRSTRTIAFTESGQRLVSAQFVGGSVSFNLSWRQLTEPITMPPGTEAAVKSGAAVHATVDGLDIYIHQIGDATAGISAYQFQAVNQYGRIVQGSIRGLSVKDDDAPPFGPEQLAPLAKAVL